MELQLQPPSLLSQPRGFGGLRLLRGEPLETLSRELGVEAGLRALVEQSIGHLANAWALRRWRGLLYRSGTSSAPPGR